jgi:AcrR family transcriptional regulator
MPRTRSIKAHTKALEAAAGLFAERGIDATSMDSIAEVSGVSKATLYKHWPDKDSLCMEVLVHLHGLDQQPPVFDSGDLRADLIAQLRYDPAAERREMKDRIWPHLMAYSARNQAFGDAWRKRVMEPAQTAFRAMIRRGRKRGLLKPGFDPETGIALLLGPLIYQHVFVRRLGRKLPKDLEEHVADAFLGAFGSNQRSPAAPRRSRPRKQTRRK